MFFWQSALELKFPTNGNSGAELIKRATSKQTFQNKLNSGLAQGNTHPEIDSYCLRISEHFMTLLQFDGFLYNQPSFIITLGSLIDLFGGVLMTNDGLQKAIVDKNNQLIRQVVRFSTKGYCNIGTVTVLF